MPYDPDVNHRVGGWLPNDHRPVENWLSKLLDRIEKTNKPLEHAHPVILEFQSLIEGDPVLYAGFQKMFEEVPKRPPYNDDPEHHPQVRDYKTMLRAFDHIIGSAPEFEDMDNSIMLPMSAILDWPMATQAGLSTFLNPKLNQQFKKMFDVWSEYLSSPASTSVLTDDSTGWFGPAATKAMPNFADTFVCDPSAPHHGFKCWDDFFTRRFRDGVRPIQFPDDDRIINNACESTVYRIARDVQEDSSITLKNQPYSLSKMLNHDELTSQFVGGTVYQAFLSATNYHRWASPVNGTVIKIVPIPGTYFAESPNEGFSNPKGPDTAAVNQSQAYITSLAARTVIYIEADNPEIGLIAFIAVGMVEVSTCEVVVAEGQKVRKGEETGMFHFGGSTHCLVFRPGVNVQFSEEYSEPGKKVPLNAAIGTVA